jgi:hypothetical protein
MKKGEEEGEEEERGGGEGKCVWLSWKLGGGNKRRGRRRSGREES